MTLRQYAGIALAAIAAWLLWQGIEAVMLLTARGSPLSDALLSPPTSAWRIVAALFAVGGGLLAAFRMPFGAVFALVGSLLFLMLGLALMLAGTDASIWMDEMIFSAVMLILSGVLLMRKRV